MKKGNMKKVYKEHATAKEMALDGWSRGFMLEQTIREMGASGEFISMEDLDLYWEELNKAYSSRKSLYEVPFNV